MSNPIIASDLFTELSNGQQEVVTGGADFELSGSNYANRLANLQGFTTSGPNGSGASSIGQTSAVNTASQDLLGLGVAQLPTGIGALGGAPVLTGLAGSPTTGGNSFTNPAASPLGGFGLGSNQ
ncbi:MAG: CTB family bacteriocin [Gloeotrichia echinulata IR180]|jgi:hypothetical protein|nr:CTB family bacteriocin [Gloeotrichia echinulata DEX184]